MQITVFCGYSKLRVGTFVQVNGGKAYSYSNNYLYFIISQQHMFINFPFYAILMHIWYVNW